MTRKFVHMYAMAVCHYVYGYYYMSAYKQYAKDFINDDAYLTKVGAIAALFNGSFKVIWATSLDYVPFRTIYGGLIWLEFSLIILVQYAVTSKPWFLVVTCLTFMCDGSLTAMLPAFTVDQFGMKRGPEVYSYMYSVMGVASLLTFIEVETINALGGSAKIIFFISGCFSFTAAVLCCTFDEKNKLKYK